MPPRAAAVRGLVDSIPHGEVGPLQSLAAADVQGAWIGGGGGDRADRSGRFRVEDRRPHASVVGRLPDAAVVHPDVEHVRLARYSYGGNGTAAAEGTDEPPAQAGEQGGVVPLRCGAGGDQDGKRDNPCEAFHASPSIPPRPLTHPLRGRRFMVVLPSPEAAWIA